MRGAYKRYACPTANHLTNFRKRCVYLPLLDSGMFIGTNKRLLCTAYAKKIYGNPLNGLVVAIVVHSI